jgi:HEPN domain-containing protein
MNRQTLQRLCEERIEDAALLLTGVRWPAAYYLAGYSLECALKSCVLAYIEKTGIIFEDKKFAEKCWTHDIEELVKQAGLIAERGMAVQQNPNLDQNWVIASQ